MGHSVESDIGVNLGGILGDEWRASKVGRYRVGLEGCPLPRRLGDLGILSSLATSRETDFGVF